jgi:hypothetical protein
MMTTNDTTHDPVTGPRWWRIPAMWLVIGGPATVVVASLATAVVAVRGGDTPLPTGRVVQPETMAPAAQARNHAATARR